MVNIELDTKCRYCSSSSIHFSSISPSVLFTRRLEFTILPSRFVSFLVISFFIFAFPQFSRRYLQCQSSMPISILRSFIQTDSPTFLLHTSKQTNKQSISFIHSFFFVGCRSPSMIRTDRLLDDAVQLHSLRSTPSSSSIPLRFTLLNTITSIGHCSCSSPFYSSSSFFVLDTADHSSRDLFPPLSPRVRSQSRSSHVDCSIVNLLSPPSSDQSMIDEITSQFGEICPPLAKKRRRRRRSRPTKCSSSVHLPLESDAEETLADLRSLLVVSAMAANLISYFSLAVRECCPFVSMCCKLNRYQWHCLKMNEFRSSCCVRCIRERERRQISKMLH